MNINFVGPDPSEFISGGNSYNSHLISALRRHGADVSISESPSARCDINIVDSIAFNDLSPAEIPPGTISLIHHLASLHPGPSNLFEEKELPFLQQFDHHIVTSRFMGEWMKDKGFQEKSLTVLEPVCSLPRSNERVPSPKLRAVMLNNVIPRKGVLPFLEALSKQNVEPYYKVTIIGDLEIDTDYSRQCQALVRNDNNLSKTIRFTGSQDTKSVQKIISASNLFISAAYFETFGMSIQEASVLGMPLLVRRGGNSCNHVSEGVNGHCVDSDKQMASVIDRLVMNTKLFEDLQASALDYHHPYASSWDDHAVAIGRLMNS